MRAIKSIYRKELTSYLRSSMGYFVAAGLLLVCGVLFQTQVLGSDRARLSADVLSMFFRICSGCTIAASIALSVRLVAEERQAHTMVLLNTSPIRDYEIVLGKFLAALTFLVFMLLTTIYMPLLIKVNGKITMTQVLVGYLGLFCLGATVLSIGLFASCLVRKQLVAAILGGVLTVVLFQLYPLGAAVDAPLRQVLQELDIWHVHFGLSFMKGIVNLKDLVYYIAVTYFFLLLATKALEAKRWQ